MNYTTKELEAPIRENKAQCCNYCGKEVVGRAGKKFCDDTCRYSFNNQLNSPATNYIRNINNALGRNRRILESLLPEGETSIKVIREQLMIEGFNLRHQTHILNTKTGNTYFYCYEYGYLPLENDLYLIVKAIGQ